MLQKAYKYSLHLIIAILLVCSYPAIGQQTTRQPASSTADTTEKATSTDTTGKKTKMPYGRQLRISLDLSAPAMSFVYNNRKGFEVAVDYAYKDDKYLVAEAGYGTGKYDYPNLSYSNSNPFIKLGFDKNMLYRNGKNDWDIGFIGIRACGGIIHRGQANYIIEDSLWGNSSGTVNAKNPFALWFEITAGVKVELMKNFFVGWTARGKIMITQGLLQELPPAYIAGYGKGDKPSAATFNLYVAYTLRWEK